MQFFGNHQCDQVLASLFEDINSGVLHQQFFLLSGEEGLGKMSMLQKHIAQAFVSGALHQQDVLRIEDLSELLGKEHTLRIQLPKTKELQNLKKADGSIYQDKGVREIAQWLTFSPLGKAKILVIEHIERMSDGASHAFLKNFEEPLSGRYIFATTKNKERVLDTILSRGFVIHYSPLNKQESLDFIRAHFSGISDRHVEFLVFFASGNPGKMQKFYALLQRDTFPLYQIFEFFVSCLKNPVFFLEHYSQIAPFFKVVEIHLLISGLSAYCLEYAPEYLPDLLALAPKTDANVSQEHLLNAFFLRIMQSSS